MYCVYMVNDQIQISDSSRTCFFIYLYGSQVSFQSDDFTYQFTVAHTNLMKTTIKIYTQSQRATELISIYAVVGNIAVHTVKWKWNDNMTYTDIQDRDLVVVPYNTKPKLGGC